MSTVEPIEDRLIEHLQPIRAHALAACIYHLFETGLYERLRTPVALDGLTGTELDPEKLQPFLKYLRNEGIVKQVNGSWSLSAKGLELDLVRGWYTMFIGGYGGTFLELGQRLRRDAGVATRESSKVGIGANQISHYDTIPLARKVARRLDVRRIVDFGCGSGLYLLEMCAELTEATALGIEPASGSIAAARASAERLGLASRVRFVQTSAFEFVNGSEPCDPDFGIIAFVLQELLGQAGTDAVEKFLRRTFDRFPRLRLLVLEIDQQVDNPSVMRHGLSQAFYNPYYLLHPFTEQRIESGTWWEALFERSGLQLESRETVDSTVDSTGLVLAYVVSRSRWS